MSMQRYEPDGTLTGEQVDLIKRTIAKDATNDELQLFIAQANRTGLDPFNHQIWFTKRQGKVSIMVGIDGYRLIGERTGRRAGTLAFWCGDDGIWKDVWLSHDKPAAAKAIVKVRIGSGEIVEYDGIALWSEYGKNADGFMWPKMPAAQLAKCAEALAYRKAFPQETSGTYVAEEMDQAYTPIDVIHREAGVTLTRVAEGPSNATAKQALLDAYRAFGLDDEAARENARQDWGDRTHITQAELDRLVAHAVPFDAQPDADPDLGVDDPRAGHLDMPAGVKPERAPLTPQQIHKHLGGMGVPKEYHARIILCETDGRTEHAANLTPHEIDAVINTGRDISEGRRTLEEVDAAINTHTQKVEA